MRLKKVQGSTRNGDAELNTVKPAKKMFQVIDTEQVDDAMTQYKAYKAAADSALQYDNVVQA